jgi:DNA polymerase
LTSNQLSKQEQLDQLQERITQELICPLKDAATNMVFGKGNPDASIVFIGEAPGEQEDLQGKPFVGRAGQELDKLLRKISLTLDDVYICNILKYRPPKNRNPTIDEIRHHTPYLLLQLKIIRPKIIVTLGNYATKFVLAGFSVEGMSAIKGIAQLHGTPQDLTLDGITFTILPFYHPAAMLYNPRLREVVDHDFMKMGVLLDLPLVSDAGGQGALRDFM